MVERLKSPLLLHDGHSAVVQDEQMGTPKVLPEPYFVVMFWLHQANLIPELKMLKTQDEGDSISHLHSAKTSTKAHCEKW